MMYMAVDQYGTTVHVGYIVGKQWITLYKVERMERSA